MGKVFDSDKAINNLRRNGFGDYRCPVCKNTSFSCQSEPSTLLLTSKFDTIELKTYVPAVLVSCNRCGHIDFFSAVKLEAYNEVSDPNEQAK